MSHALSNPINKLSTHIVQLARSCNNVRVYATKREKNMWLTFSFPVSCQLHVSLLQAAEDLPELVSPAVELRCSLPLQRHHSVGEGQRIYLYVRGKGFCAHSMHWWCALIRTFAPTGILFRVYFFQRFWLLWKWWK